MWPILVLAAGAGGTIWQVSDMKDQVTFMADEQREHSAMVSHPVGTEKIESIEKTVEKNSEMLLEQQVVLTRLCSAVGC
tara:strand:- start:294 stop:530 length:237 start_codon:yes stop_codon:yes gene_type:complete